MLLIFIPYINQAILYYINVISLELVTGIILCNICTHTSKGCLPISKQLYVKLTRIQRPRHTFIHFCIFYFKPNHFLVPIPAKKKCIKRKSKYAITKIVKYGESAWFHSNFKGGKTMVIIWRIRIWITHQDSTKFCFFLVFRL